MQKILIPLSIGLLLACSSPQKTEQVAVYETTGSVERSDSRIDQLIPADAQIEILASGFEWSEGPLWLEDLQALIFTDVPTNKIWKWSEKDSLTLYLEPSGYFGDRAGKREPGANGLALDREGNLLLCQHGERQVGRMKASLTSPRADFDVLVSGFNGKRFNSPNDLVLSTKGEIYFTDPPYGLDEWDEKELDYQGVYKIDTGGVLSLQIDSLSRPNGIGLSPDERTLYIGQSDPEKARYYAFDLDEKGDVVSGRILLDVTELVGEERKGLPDGLKIDKQGNLFATGPGGVLIISPEGKHMGTILTGQGTANCAFDASENYLYMTADMYLMRIRLN